MRARGGKTNADIVDPSILSASRSQRQLAVKCLRLRPNNDLRRPVAKANLLTIGHDDSRLKAK